MHPFQPPAEPIGRAVARTGRRYWWDSFVPSRTALIVVDMQNYFVMPGQPAACPVARGIVPDINRLAESLRRAGGTVIWLKMAVADRSLGDWSVITDRLQPDARERRFAELAPGGTGFELWPEMDVLNTDEVLERLQPVSTPSTDCRE